MVLVQQISPQIHKEPLKYNIAINGELHRAMWEGNIGEMFDKLF